MPPYLKDLTINLCALRWVFAQKIPILHKNPVNILRNKENLLFVNEGGIYCEYSGIRQVLFNYYKT